MEIQSLDFLFQAAFKTMHTNPEISRLLMIRYHHQAIQNQFKIPFTILKVFCHKCGSIFLPGKNCRLRVVDKVTEKTFLVNTRPILKHDPVMEHVLYTCDICKTTTQFYARQKSDMEPKREKIQEKPAGVSKKKKSLANLLASTKKTNTFSLDDFIDF